MSWVGYVKKSTKLAYQIDLQTQKLMNYATP